MQMLGIISFVARPGLPDKPVWCGPLVDASVSVCRKEWVGMFNRLHSMCYMKVISLKWGILMDPASNYRLVAPRSSASSHRLTIVNILSMVLASSTLSYMCYMWCIACLVPAKLLTVGNSCMNFSRSLVKL